MVVMRWVVGNNHRCSFVTLLGTFLFTCFSDGLLSNLESISEYYINKSIVNTILKCLHKNRSSTSP